MLQFYYSYLLVKRIEVFKKCVKTYQNGEFFCYNENRGDLMKYLSVGQATYDVTLLVDEYPKKNEKKKTDIRICSGGGCAANAAYLLASWGQDSYFAGTIGNDKEGSIIEDELKSKKVNLKYLSKQDIMTPISYIITTKDASRTLVTYKKDNTVLKNNHKIENDFDCLILDGYEKEFADKALFENKNAVSILDAGRVNYDITDLCHKVDYIITSKSFAEKYTNIELKTDKDLKKAYDVLSNRFNTDIIITLESKGCYTKIGKDYMKVPTIDVEAVDTTAAGDIFHAAFAYFITHGYNMLTSLRLSNIAASLSTRHFGSKNSVVALSEVLDIYYEEYNN